MKGTGGAIGSFSLFLVCIAERSAGHENIHISTPPAASSLPFSKLNALDTQLRLSKMFSKSLRQPDNVRPFWLTASEPATRLSIATVLTLDDMDSLELMATNWRGKDQSRGGNTEGLN
jgi:hypothetical protein